jgi:hypothetical protein
MSNGINILVGKTLSSIIGEERGEEIEFTTTEGKKYSLYHIQDCCEDVCVEDICGDLQSLVGSPITMAECITKEDDTRGECGMWTFYKLATIKGYVDIRWYGSSDYYSLEVDFREVEK